MAVLSVIFSFLFLFISTSHSGSYLLLAIASLMLFGTCYDVYVHRPLTNAIRQQQMVESNGRAVRQLPVEPRSRLMVFLLMFSMVGIFNFFWHCIFALALSVYFFCPIIYRPEIWTTSWTRGWRTGRFVAFMVRWMIMVSLYIGTEFYFDNSGARFLSMCWVKR